MSVEPVPSNTTVSPSLDRAVAAGIGHGRRVHGECRLPIPSFGAGSPWRGPSGGAVPGEVARIEAVLTVYQRGRDVHEGTVIESATCRSVMP